MPEIKRTIMAKTSWYMLPPLSAFILYILGGVLFFTGVFLISILADSDLFGWGSARTIGYVMVCVGASFSVLGVLVLRLVRNRTDCLLSQSAKRL